MGITGKIAKAAVKELKESDKVASCYDKVGSNLFKNPIKAIQDFGACLFKGKISKKKKRRR